MVFLFLKAAASGATAFAARYSTAKLSSNVDNFGSPQINNSFGEVAFAQLKLAASHNAGKHHSSAPAQVTANFVAPIAAQSLKWICRPDRAPRALTSQHFTVCRFLLHP
jgi:hypothetical protein